MTDKREWQGGVGKTWSEAWQLTDRSFAGLTGPFLDMIASLPGRKVLDVGCGAGELALAIARKRTDARVIGVDVSPDLVEAARKRAGDWPAVDFELGDAATWSREGFAPELLVSRHGVMFFDDPVAAFTHLRAISAPSARLAFTCFRARSENEWAEGLASLLPDGGALPDSAAPGPFAFADSARINAILSAAGWSGIRIEPLDFAYVAGAGEDPLTDAQDFFSRIGPSAPVLRALDGEARERFMQRLRHWLGQNRRGNMVAFGAAAWQVTARRD